MTQQIPELKSVSTEQSTKDITTEKVMGRPKRERISDLLTKKQKDDLLAKAYKLALAGDPVMIKSFVEQIYGRPVATVEAKVDANVSIEMINYGESTDPL